MSKLSKETKAMINFQMVLQTCVVRVSQLYGEPLSSASAEWHVNEDIKRKPLPLILKEPKKELKMIIMPFNRELHTYKDIKEIPYKTMKHVHEEFKKHFEGEFVTLETFHEVLKFYDKNRECYTFIPVEFFAEYLAGIYNTQILIV